MRIGLERQTKVAAVGGRVNGLLHGAQQHAVNLLGVGPLFGGLGDGLVLARAGVVADRQPQAQGLEVVGQGFAFLGGRALMHPKQSGMLALQYKVRAAHIGGQHGLFDQTVSLGAHTGNDFFNPPAVVTHNLGFGGFKVHRTPHLPGLQQSSVNIVQVF